MRSRIKQKDVFDKAKSAICTLTRTNLKIMFLLFNFVHQWTKKSDLMEHRAYVRVNYSINLFFF